MLLDTSQVPPPKPWERLSGNAQGGNVERGVLTQVERSQGDSRGTAPFSSSVLTPPDPTQSTVVSSLGASETALALGRAVGIASDSSSHQGYDAESLSRIYSRGTAVDACNSNTNAYNWNASYTQRSREDYVGNHYYTAPTTGNYYGNLGFGTTNPLYASSYGAYRNAPNLSFVDDEIPVLSRM
ncbi:conserved hypothetical protein [Neospora caninum Liverpool]|uniref:Uncharacterized protein n=1 Tax=Neospora caninum (strain Liverpool) TaxID=572307 RepID=F0VBC5_NEOCL|nr:conserved hypothetical protein [Neospora caninum Liverpool]CBZ50909.1 conserved hypothetical protein [Neospora caninum Liverpool]CEL68211.1 TPA: hypothetical protein BN1204_039840 [Neospora caninum Liverpool]|eukprot:XP_003880942.1 conserved hypothetical protein [Neospora caninum Liverpool]